jgi:hypothetical protein
MGQRERDLLAAHPDQDHPARRTARIAVPVAAGFRSTQRHVRLDHGIGQRRFTYVDDFAGASSRASASKRELTSVIAT